MRVNFRNICFLRSLAGLAILSLGTISLNCFVPTSHAQEIETEGNKVQSTVVTVPGLKLQKLTMLDRLEMGLSPLVNPNGVINKFEVYVYKYSDLVPLDNWLENINRENSELPEIFAKPSKSSDELAVLLRWKIALSWQIGWVENIEDHSFWLPVNPLQLSDYYTPSEDELAQLIGSTKLIPGFAKLGTYWVDAVEWIGRIDKNSVDLWLSNSNTENSKYSTTNSFDIDEI